MAKEYQWRTSTNFSSTTTLSNGVDPNTYQNWQKTSVLSNNVECAYWFRDANTMPYTDANSSRIVFRIADNWTVSFDSKNNMTVRLTTTLQSVVRDEILGTVPDSPGRHIVVSQNKGGAQVWEANDLQVGTAHVLLGSPIQIDQRTVVLPPGQQASFSSLFIRNETVGMPSWDEVYAGVEFQNILPPDYRPGDVRYGGHWKSTNRDAGKCHIRQGGQWVEMRTIDGGSGTNDPPKRRSGGVWKNQYLIGEES